MCLLTSVTSVNVGKECLLCKQDIQIAPHQQLYVTKALRECARGEGGKLPVLL